MDEMEMVNTGAQMKQHNVTGIYSSSQKPAEHTSQSLNAK